MTRPPKAVSDYMARIGAKGGKAKGSRKKRPSAHYKAAAAKRWKKKPEQEEMEDDYEIYGPDWSRDD